jgi:hypothetical protein
VRGERKSCDHAVDEAFVIKLLVAAALSQKDRPTVHIFRAFAVLLRFRKLAERPPYGILCSINISGYYECPIVHGPCTAAHQLS